MSTCKQNASLDDDNNDHAGDDNHTGDDDTNLGIVLCKELLNAPLTEIEC